MGNSNSFPYEIYSYKDVQNCIQNKDDCIIISTMSSKEQNCLIQYTCDIQKEEEIINRYLNTNKLIKICIYGKHSADTSVFKKYEQLKSLGFSNIFIYSGGLFEWLCLQDIYTTQFFPTTFTPIDILDYSPNVYNLHRLSYI